MVTVYNVLRISSPQGYQKLLPIKDFCQSFYKSLKILLTNEKSIHFFINKRRVSPEKKNFGIIETIDRPGRAHKKKAP
jgi:hypothetical protein